MKENSKKKGFTLIELIAVIAILGILAAVLVPNIIGYTNKARKAKVIADAKIVVNAISAYNSDADTIIADTVAVNSTTVIGNTAIVGTTGSIKSVPLSLGSLTITNCKAIADGTMVYGSTTGQCVISSAGVASVN